MTKKKTRSQRKEERRQKRMRIWIGVLITALMVLSSFAFVLVYHTPEADGAQSQFFIRGNQRFANLNGQEVQFYSYPGSFTIPEEVGPLLRNAAVLVVAFDPTDQANIQYVEIIRWDLSNYLNALPGAVLLAESDQYSFPQGDCSIATPTAPVVQIINGTTNISVEGSCITLQGQQHALLQLRDEIIWAALS